MANRGLQSCPRTTTLTPRAILWPAIACALLYVCPLLAQKLESLPMDPSAVRPPQLKDHFLEDRLPLKPTVPPFATIPLDPLDFATPNPVYIGHRFTMASLDFLDENHLLFTFRVPGLIPRTPANQGDQDEHNIRAVLLSIPSGNIEAQAQWVLHGRDRYIWPLKNGQFLLRDGALLSVGDSRLDLKPFLTFPGPVLAAAMDPDQKYLLTYSREPVAEKAQSGEGDDSSDGNPSSAVPDVVLRIFRRDSGDILNVTRVRTMVELPMNSQGVLQALQGYSNEWNIRLNSFTGDSKKVAQVVSQCMPALKFVSGDELLATTCKPEGGYGLIGIATNGQLLWQDSTSGYSVWPILRRSDTGLRFLRETLAVTRQIGTFWALDRTDVKAQRVRVFNAADGNVALEATVDPVLDAGGNAAISPSGRRVALLSNGQIQVFNLPAPPPLPAAAHRAPVQ